MRGRGRSLRPESPRHRDRQRQHGHLRPPFCEAHGVDYIPDLIEQAKERAAAEGLDVVFDVGDAENLPYPDAAFDVVHSTVGVMFTPDQEKAAQELLRDCKPGGKIGLAIWVPDGYVGNMFRTVGKHFPPPGVKPPLLWGTEDRLRELLHELRVHPRDKGTVAQVCRRSWKRVIGRPCMLDNLLAEYMIVCTKVIEANPECFILSTDEVKDLANRNEKDGEVSYWLELRDHESEQFRERWDRMGSGVN